MLLRPATAKGLAFLFLLPLLIVPQRASSTKTANTLASDSEKGSPVYQSIVLELLSFPLLATNNCQNLCEERSKALINFLHTGFQGPNLLENVTPYNQDVLKFWIDECLAHRVFCIVNADIWLTDDDLSVMPESDPETAWNKLKEHARTCSKRPASIPGNEPQCGSNKPFLSKCICRRILYLQIVRNKHYSYRTGGASKMERPSESLECNATPICSRLDSRLRLWDPATGRWFCNDGLLNKQFNLERRGNSRAIPRMCPCSAKKQAFGEKFVPCVSEEEFRDAMEAASMTPLQIHSVKTYQVPRLLQTAEPFKSQSIEYDWDVNVENFAFPRPSLDELHWCAINDRNIDPSLGTMQPGTSIAADASMCMRYFQNFPAAAPAFPAGQLHPFHVFHQHPFHVFHQHESYLESLEPVSDMTGSQQEKCSAG